MQTEYYWCMKIYATRTCMYVMTRCLPVIIMHIIKKRSAMQVRIDSDFRLISPKTPAPQYQPIETKK